MGLFDNFCAIRCNACDVVFGLTETMAASRKSDGKDFFCPNGHSLSYRETDADRLRKERDALLRRVEYRDNEIKRLRDDCQSSDRRAAAARGQITKLKKRFGVDADQ